MGTGGMTHVEPTMFDLNTSRFPSDSTARKAILVLGQHDFEKCEDDRKGAEILANDEIFVLAYPVRLKGDMPEVLRNIIRQNLARPGEMLIQSPFDPDVYVPAASAPERFALDKHMKVTTLCYLLGAKSFQVEQIDLRTSSGKTTLVMNASRVGANGSGSIEHDKLESLKNQMTIRTKFAGSLPDIEAAQDLLRKTGLSSDPNLQTLIDMRRGKSNTLLSHKMILSLSKEVQSNLNVAARAEIPNFVNISSDYKKVVQNKNEYTVTMDVEF
jgi:hypothetical protein